MEAGRQQMQQRTGLTRDEGFTLLAVLAAMFILALATHAVVANVAQQVQREREAELLRVGSAYAEAIRTYYEQSPGNVKRWPTKLDDLLDDKRSVVIKRHIRRLYADPVSRSPEWGLVVASEGGITGVYSLSRATPIRTASVELRNLTLPPASRYADWQFVYQPVAATAVNRKY